MTKPELLLPDSPKRKELAALLQTIITQAKASLTKDDLMAVNNAIYLIVEKRFANRLYEGHLNDYIMQLISDVESAKFEFNSVCYANEYAEAVFRKVKQALLVTIVETD